MNLKKNKYGTITVTSNLNIFTQRYLNPVVVLLKIKNKLVFLLF